ncbi:CHAT domain-containing protein [Flavilitoribacter nigricans]|uniref:CHAT domain-containing protein n=1 Tax=Flavilitoribacter nigricans (strain ATCC 23147 / DSM 23189 / NBRC 102662 / NCIMB 1420 / SS-2) TaxID=1122177 RepID=A0A2D0NFC1_FLAN2|nr:CHAT domain-containing tetratricopeptide repeat protein [Flavilitoribacter nigricans]PHN07177.1 hypothetical protein CRP01_08100 [Flavilitoribacter nigricans DSM 23189 = NBRC 102662]
MLTPAISPKLPRELYAVLLTLLLSVGYHHGLSALGVYQNDPEEIREVARNHFNLARELRLDGQLEAADRHFSQAQQYYRQLADWSIIVSSAIYRSQINYDLDRLDSMRVILEEAQRIIDRETLSEENFKQERIYYFRALYLEKTAQYQAASKMLDRATSILTRLEKLIALDSAYLSSHKSASGSIYYERRDFEMAINHYQAALAIFPVTRPDPEKQVGIYNNLGLAMIEMGQLSQGMDYLQKSLDILPDLDPRKEYEDFLQTYFNLIRAYLLRKQLPAAQKYLNLAREILRDHPQDLHHWYSLMAQLQEQQSRLPEALSNYRASFEARKEARGADHPSVAKVQLAIGQLSHQMQDERAALRAFQRGLQIFDRQLDSTDYYAVPRLEKISDYYLLIQLLNHRGSTLKRLYPEASERILPTFRTAIRAIDSLRLLYESDASKLLLSKEAKSVFASALELLYRQYQQQQDPALLEEAFQYMEKSKALLLLENIRKWRNIRLQRSAPKDRGDRFTELLEEEKNAKLDLILLQRTIEDLQKNAGEQSGEKLDNLERELQKVYGQYQTIKSALSDSFPQYYRASYGDALAGIGQIREELLRDKGTRLVSYFIFGDQSFAMLIRPEGAVFQQLPELARWENDFKSYQKALRTQGKALLEPATYESYVHSASRLYDVLLRQLLPEDAADELRLYLIPDDILGFLAFESLLVSPPSGDQISYAPAQQDYLIEHHALAYGYSATLLLESIHRTDGPDERSDYGGFAPVFREGDVGRAISRDCTTGSLMYLPYSEKSVQETQEILEGTAYLNEQASLQNFKASADKYRILQLATHACVDEQDALFNVIYFHDTTLATYEIFDIPMRADLIILSACETGNGDLLEGEGIMSLSRGFYYAGSANIVTSLWPADDYATQTLMVQFNRYLKEGLPKDRALQRAKLDFLNAPNLRSLSAAPSFWANFILIGNQEKIELDAQRATWHWFLLPFLGVSLILALFYGLSWRK